MSRDIRQYWQELRAVEASLPEFVWLVSVVGGVVTQVSSGVAARLLRGKKFREATEDEVAAHHGRELEANRAAREERMRREGTSLVVVRPK